MGNDAIYEHSQEKWIYDAMGQWLISEETVGAADRGAEAYVTLNKPLAAFRGLFCDLPYFSHIIPQAFENHDDKLSFPKYTW